MKHKIDPELLQICKEIQVEDKKLSEWSEIESGDWFQRGKYRGGFEAEEQAFTFSYYNKNGEEFWFQIGMDEVGKIVDGQINEIDIIKADK